MAQRGRPRHAGLLTQREEDVLVLLRENLTNEQIADRLGISFETAKHHVSQVLSKLNVSTREEAAAWQPPDQPPRWTPARVGLAIGGVAVFAAAVAGLALLAWGVSESSGRQTSEETAPPASGASPVPATPDRATATPTPPPPETPPIERVTSFDADGTYVYDTQTGELFRTWPIGSWMPDGRALAYSQCCLSAGSVVFLNLEEQAEASVPGLGATDVFAAAASPDGSHYVFSRGRDKFPESNGVFVLRAGETEPTQIASGIWPLWSWSPDSRYLAYTTKDSTFLYDIRGNTNVQLPLVGGVPMGLSWSPTANVLATTSPQGLFIYDAETGNTRTVVEGEVNGPPVWSPDGGRLLARYGETAEVMWLGPDEVLREAIINLDGSFVQLPATRGRAWSPDGSQVLYLAHSTNVPGDQFHVYTVDTGEDISISSGPDLKEAMAWSPDPQTIAYASISDAFLYDVETGVHTHLGAIPDFVSHYHDFRWSPDGRYLEILLAGGHS